MYCYSCMNEIKDGNYCYKCMKENVSEASPHQLKAGTVLHGKYFVGNPIGEGGFGITYIGKDTVLGKRVAIKEFFPSGSANRNNELSNNVAPNSSSKEAFFEKGKQNFLVEARSLAHYDNEPGIVDVIDFFEENNTVYIIMEYLDGINLNDFLKKNGVFKAETLFTLMLPIMKSLEKIHADGVVHRDITPDNIMYLYDGTLKLMDFGSARFITNESSDVSVILKEGYAPEEQYRKNGKQGPWTDVYGMCSTIYRCITGKIPDGGLDRIREDKLKKPSDLGADISIPLEKVLMYGMAVFHENRCQNMTELMDMTKRALNSEQININKSDSVADDINKTRMADEVYRTQAADEIYKNNFQDMRASENVHSQNVMGMHDNSLTPKPKKKKTGLIVGIIIVVVAIVGAVSAFIIFNNSKNNDSDKNSEEDVSSTVLETTAEPTTIEETTIQETTQEPETVVLVQVPDVEGMKSDDAISKLAERNLGYSIQLEESDRVDLDYVISQSPVGGREVEEGDTVTIYVSKTSQQPETEEPTSRPMVVGNGSTMLYCRASEFATLRESPSRSSKAIVKIFTDETVDKLGESGDFYYVRFGDDTGYVLKDFFSRDPYAPLNYDDGNPD